MAYHTGDMASISTLSGSGNVPTRTDAFNFAFTYVRPPAEVTVFGNASKKWEMTLPTGGGYFDVHLNSANATPPLPENQDLTAVFTVGSGDTYSGTIRIEAMQLSGANIKEARGQVIRYTFRWNSVVTVA